MRMFVLLKRKTVWVRGSLKYGKALIVPVPNDVGTVDGGPNA